MVALTLAPAWELCTRFRRSLQKTWSKARFKARAKRSLLQSQFMLLEQLAAARLNEFQFPGFITQPGAGGRGDLWLHQNLSEFLRVPVNWLSALGFWKPAL